MRQFTFSDEDLEAIATQRYRQRPSTAVGLLQFAKRVPAVWDAAGELRLPPTIEVLDDGSWRWSDQLSVASLAGADAKLRELLSIPADRRIPLIAD